MTAIRVIYVSHSKSAPIWPARAGGQAGEYNPCRAPLHPTPPHSRLRSRKSDAPGGDGGGGGGGFALWRNARVLASQSPERMAAGLDGAVHPSIWWRVLLQRYLLDELGWESGDWRVGRIGAKSADTLHFFR